MFWQKPKLKQQIGYLVLQELKICDELNLIPPNTGITFLKLWVQKQKIIVVPLMDNSHRHRPAFLPYLL